MSIRGETIEYEDVPVKIGRDYRIDYLEVADVLMNHEDEMLATLTQRQREGKEGSNINGIIDYAMGGIKGPLTPEHILSYQDLRVFPTQVDPDRTVKRLGVLFFARTRAEFDLVDSTNALVIKREAPLIEVMIPRVDFSKAIKKILKPEIMSKSLDLLADYLASHDQDIEYMMGLTNPRIGKLAKRWGLLMEEHPFTPEVYSFIEMGLQEPDVDIDCIAVESLEAFKNQVLIYQPRQEFILRAKNCEQSCPVDL